MSGGRNAALGIGIANLFGRLTGLARDVIFAAVFGAGSVSDAYNAALRVPQLLRELVAEGSLQNVIVPAFSDTAEREGVAAAWKLAEAVLGVLLVVLGVATLAFWALADGWVQLVASGFAADPDKLALAATLTRWLSPFLAGLSLAAYFGGLLNSRGRFFVPALAQNVLNLGVIAACVVGPWWAARGGPDAIVVVAALTTLTGFVQAGLCVPPLWREGFRFRPSFSGHPALGRLLVWFGTALVGVVTVQFNLLVESQWASDFGDGVLTWLLGSFRLVQLPLALVAGSLATTLLPELSAAWSRGEADGSGALLTRALRTHASLVVPAAVGLGVLAEPIVGLVYERGAFDHADTVGTASMLRMYAWACYGICLHRILVPVCYAIGRPRLPMWLSLGAMGAKIPVVLVLTRGAGLGADALPLSHAVTVTTECVGLFWGLRTLLAGRGLGGHHVRVGLAAGAMGAVAWALSDRAHVLVVVLAAGAVYGVLAAALGVLALPARGKPLVPPFVDPATAALLERARTEVVHPTADALHFGPDAYVVRVVDAALVLRPAGTDGVRAAATADAGADGFGIRPGPAPRLVAIRLGGLRFTLTADAPDAPVWLDLPKR